uniref:FAD-dependent oxidoreductase domain-containing protein 1 n=1 Tax=Aceria tosichella TaxID=561515 RepID=A0A6G1SBI9_9ACAR
MGFRMLLTTKFTKKPLLSRTRVVIITTRGNTNDASQVGEKKESATKQTPKVDSSLQKYKIPDEDPDIPKKHVFQQLRRIRQQDAVFTLEEAAKFKAPDSFGKSWKYPTAFDQLGNMEYSFRSYENEHSVITQFPDATDFLIVGSGLIGSATAYYCKKMASRCADIAVIDKDPYSPHNCTALCNGLISSQSKSRDISRIATLSKELIRTLRNDVLVEEDDFAQIKYRPVTHLILWPEVEIDDVMTAVDSQIKDGCYTRAKLPEELELTWPWLNVIDSDVHLGTHGDQDEAIVDPIGLRNLYRTLAQAHGANFIQAEALDFNMQYNINTPQMHPFSAGAVLARVTSGQIKSVMVAKTLLCLGHNTPFLEARAEMEDEIRDSIQDLHFLQPKLRLCFIFNSMAAPIINFPVITDTDGSVLLRDDYAGTFKYYLTLDECDKFFEEDNEVFMSMDSDNPFPNLFHKGKKFEDYFVNTIKPRLVKRIPVMEDAKFLLTNSGFESVNTYDACPIVSLHPFHQKIVLSGGYGKRLMSFAPLAAASLSELLILDEEETFDVTNFYWDRVIKGRKVDEFHSLVA